MKKHTIHAVALAALLSAGSTAAFAQYTGPSSIPQSTVKQLIDSGTDDQKAILKGRIVSHDGKKNYTFEDSTGRMSVEISDKRMPAGQAFDDKREVELTGELDKDRNKVEFDVDSVRLL
jgi:uncharacterized protein (TIGR00156 family)